VAVSRQPLSRWKYPSNELLIKRAFASDKPPFAPFPTVSNLMNAALCPVAIFHDLIHGQANALIGNYEVERRGDLFAGFIAYLKFALKKGELLLKGDRRSMKGQVQTIFTSYSQQHGFPINATTDLWKSYMDPWVERKLDNGELFSIGSASQLFFEVTVANPKTPFPIEGGIRNYPLIGRVDEIDLTNKRIIERTIKGSNGSELPPKLKDYQVWLYKQLLCSLSVSQKPPQWKDVDFNTFETMVETPFMDYVIEENPQFVEDTHSGYAWISDISTSESQSVFKEVFQNQACAPENPNEDCGFPFITCFHKRYAYPRARPEIRQAFQPWFRMLLWEQVWSGHLWRYRALMLNRDELLEQGIILESKIVGNENGTIELELPDKTAASLRGYDYCTIIPFGTMSCGLNLPARLVKTKDNRVFLHVSNRATDLSDYALLLVPPEGVAPMISEPPNFLQRQTQSSLFWLKNVGTEDPDKANQESTIQLLEAVFGTKRLRRGKK
jgi:hypothetical protein